MVNINKNANLADLKILAAIEADARTPITVLAKKARISRAVAEYRLRSLEKKGAIRGYYCLLDPSKFGLTVWKLWISLRGSQSQKQEFYSHIQSNPRVWWYAECAGTYDAVICVLARTVHGFNNFFLSLQEKYGDKITDSAILINVSFEYHTRGYLLGRQSSLIQTSFLQKISNRKIPDGWNSILKPLSANSRISYSELSMKTGKNAKTIKKAITELKRAGIIVYFRPSIDTAILGYEFYKVLVYLHNSPGGIVPSIVHWCRAQQNITAMIYCVGPWQLELEVEIGSFANLMKMLRELKDRFPDLIKSYDALLITKEGNYELDLMDKIRKITD
ncbi:Lrp/AsnC family transcriptional regulator [Candidatus Woesearchaeota archaeon]|nr:Lrp/AsnC family transcriptional regulator [Candidatus Woesearchaeota archaeon]